jgi:hypothetical protein
MTPRRRKAPLLTWTTLVAVDSAKSALGCLTQLTSSAWVTCGRLKEQIVRHLGKLGLDGSQPAYSHGTGVWTHFYPSYSGRTWRLVFRAKDRPSNPEQQQALIERLLAPYPKALHTMLDASEPERWGNFSHVLASPAAMASRFPDHPEAVAEDGGAGRAAAVRPRPRPRLPLSRL